ncbi:hypothetical protein LA76x_1084 [Lysobacter antibioticus]|uniref:Uncharacterized protein n=1 Tax=Lysobacter antibioticus TaxID=84531 RepID=A0A0S2F6U7_LYSAN|nr:hypothetical protein LA76x_1084 [Lysobacter antibioticus]
MLRQTIESSRALPISRSNRDGCCCRGVRRLWAAMSANGSAIPAESGKPLGRK